jgi:hypothetical protein
MFRTFLQAAILTAPLQHLPPTSQHCVQLLLPLSELLSDSCAAAHSLQATLTAPLQHLPLTC